MLGIKIRLVFDLGNPDHVGNCRMTAVNHGVCLRWIMEFICGLRLAIVFQSMQHLFFNKSWTSKAKSHPLSMPISVGHGHHETKCMSNSLAVQLASLPMTSHQSKNHVET